MKRLQPYTPMRWSNSPRYAQIHDMVTDLLIRTEPGRYAAALKDFRAEWKPVGAQVHLVELMADLDCRLHGCLCLETEILREGMEACAGEGVTHEMALGRAFVRDCEGPNLLDRLSSYQSHLSRELSQCIRLLTQSRKRRSRHKARMTAKLMRSKPCTSVIQ